MEYELVSLTQRYLNQHEVLGRSPATVQHYRDTFLLLTHYLQERTLPCSSRSLTSEVMSGFIVWLREKPTRGWRGSTVRSPFSINGNIKDLKAFFRWLTDEGLLTRVIKVPTPKLPQTLFPILTDEDIAKIWACQHLTFPGDLGKRNRALLALMFDTGVRRGEVTGLTLADLDLDNQLIMVLGKGNKQRRVPFSTGVAVLLGDWIKARSDDEGSLFYLKPAGLRMLFDRIQHDTGIKILHPHGIRHTAATHMVRANMDIHSVKRVLGHSHISTTERYLSLSDQDLSAKHQAASPFERMRGAVAAPTTAKKRLSRR